MKDLKTYRTFVRFGKLGLIKQKGYSSDTFHSPPARRGFYAMPLRFQESFLIGSLTSTQGYKKLGFPKPIKGFFLGDEPEYIEYEKRYRNAFKRVRHEFIIETNVCFWHHLNVPNHLVIERNKDWVKTSFKVWLKALMKESVKLRAENLKYLVDEPKSINSVKKRTGDFSKDHFEVFFDIKI